MHSFWNWRVIIEVIIVTFVQMTGKKIASTMMKYTSCQLQYLGMLDKVTIIEL